MDETENDSSSIDKFVKTNLDQSVTTELDNVIETNLIFDNVIYDNVIYNNVEKITTTELNYKK